MITNNRPRNAARPTAFFNDKKHLNPVDSPTRRESPPGGEVQVSSDFYQKGMRSTPAPVKRDVEPEGR